MLQQSDKEMAAKAVWMVAVEKALDTCKQMNLGTEATLVGMVSTVTFVLRQLFADNHREDC